MELWKRICQKNHEENIYRSSKCIRNIISAHSEANEERELKTDDEYP